MKRLICAIALSGSLTAVYAQQEDCGTYPTGLKALFGDAKDKFEACNARRNEAQRQSAEAYFNGQKDIVNRTQESCSNAVRRMSTQPSTLAFDLVRYERCCGLNSANVDITDGGYSVKLTGSDISGRFRVMCYMDKRFTITNVK